MNIDMFNSVKFVIAGAVVAACSGVMANQVQKNLWAGATLTQVFGVDQNNNPIVDEAYITGRDLGRPNNGARGNARDFEVKLERIKTQQDVKSVVKGLKSGLGIGGYLRYLVPGSYSAAYIDNLERRFNNGQVHGYKIMVKIENVDTMVGAIYDDASNAGLDGKAFVFSGYSGKGYAAQAYVTYAYGVGSCGGEIETGNHPSLHAISSAIDRGDLICTSRQNHHNTNIPLDSTDINNIIGGTLTKQINGQTVNLATGNMLQFSLAPNPQY